MKAKAIMVLGTTSGAGKSWLATALCRWYARQGLKVAPFKAQNMSNNARVVADGEMGSAQYFQALAAQTIPDVRMNPLLLKPEKDTQSQVIKLGRVDLALSRMAWHQRSANVWPIVTRALDELINSHEIIVIEGAGSPAEINLSSSDIVNMRIARHAQARCLLVTDIDRGGAFAHLYGTYQLLNKMDRKRIKGFVLNKFRGDASLLAPGPQQLQKLTGVPTVAVLPWWPQHGLPEEDGVFDDRTTASGPTMARTVTVVMYPHISNIDEFQPLKNLPGVRLKWARHPAELKDTDSLVLPGSKHTSSDLAWLREHQLDRAIIAHATAGGAVLGICGGLQMLGDVLKDPHGIDGNAKGLGLLPLVTEFHPIKIVKQRRATFTTLAGPWAGLSGISIQGYEIHNGHTEPSRDADTIRTAMRGNLAWQNTQGNVLGIYLHGLFENPAVQRALLGATASPTESVFEGLAHFIDQHFQKDTLNSLVDFKTKDRCARISHDMALKTLP